MMILAMAGFFGAIVSLVFLLIAFLKKRPKKVWAWSLLLCLVIFVCSEIIYTENLTPEEKAALTQKSLEQQQVAEERKKEKAEQLDAKRIAETEQQIVDDKKRLEQEQIENTKTEEEKQLKENTIIEHQKNEKYSMVNPNSYSSDSPERAFVDFLTSWQDKDWSGMTNYTQLTWASEENNPTDTLEAWYGFKDLLGATINDKRVISNTTVDIIATIYYSIGNGAVVQKDIKARVICESAPFQPSTSGKWGINPVSTLRESGESSINIDARTGTIGN